MRRFWRRNIDYTPFDRHRIPPKQNPLFAPLIWLFCWLVTRQGRLKIRKTRMKGLKPPFLVLGTHHAFMDFYVTPLALFPRRANYVSELEGFEYFGEWLYRQVGCLGTRKFVNDQALVRNIRRVMDRDGILVLYPEARYANVGTSSTLPPSVGKLCKMLGVPVVCINMRGNYLQSPIWNLNKRREARLEAEIAQLFTREEVEGASAAQIQQAVQEFLTYDEYRWQYEKGMAITYPRRAEGLQLVLYQCIACGREFAMAAKGAELYCTGCGARWRMSELGRLEPLSPHPTGESIHIPHWYQWQREQVEGEIMAGRYALAVRVRVEALPNAKNFIDMGEAMLRHNPAGFSLEFPGPGAPPPMTFASMGMTSIHTEYQYRGKGQCITLSTVDNTYFLFPREEGFNATKIQFATERFYQLALQRRKLAAN